jgi:hypothetical protein
METRTILLLEPNYSNKYPPIGLMKIATYHRNRGDEVRFFKGDLRELVLELFWEACLEQLRYIDSETPWEHRKPLIKRFIKYKKAESLEALEINDNQNYILIYNCLVDYANRFRRKDLDSIRPFDRVYITTLFTFYWKITVETIEFAKKLVRHLTDIRVGGVLASLLHHELAHTTGIEPMKGLLDKPGMLDPGDLTIVDDLPLDYSILDEIEYDYPTRSAYFTFMTKGCTRKCSFCSVPILEPTYKPKIDTFGKFAEIKTQFGEQQNLLLMDNNVLASPKFSEIIEEIKAMGFVKGATYIEPNQLEIAIKNLETGYNDRGFIRRTYRLLHDMLKRLKGEPAQTFYSALDQHDLLDPDTTTKAGLLAAYPAVSSIYEKYRNKAPKQRYVDFNQGTDARYVTDENMALMAQIPIRPLRIAFDYIGLEKQYTAAVRLAAKHGIRQLSNYILYNFQDKPDELWQRLKINADLCIELEVEIFSFPMKYIPLFGEEAKHREYTGKHWSKKFIRAIQSILNVTKGIVAPSVLSQKSSFFYEAFGKDLIEFHEILYMPEAYIIYRHKCRYDLEWTPIWEAEYRSLSESDRVIAHQIIEANVFSGEVIGSFKPSEIVKNFLRHYTLLGRKDFTAEDENFEKLKRQYDDLIRKDQFIELTLTYDFS